MTIKTLLRTPTHTVSHPSYSTLSRCIATRQYYSTLTSNHPINSTATTTTLLHPYTSTNKYHSSTASYQQAAAAHTAANPSAHQSKIKDEHYESSVRYTSSPVTSSKSSVSIPSPSSQTPPLSDTPPARSTTSTSPSSSKPVITIHNKTDKKRIVALGTGWSSFMFVRGLDRSKFDVSVISPRNHFLFTPLLASTTTGTLEYRSIIEPIRTVPNVTFYESHAENIDFDEQRVQVKDVFEDRKFEVPYDYLIIGVGSRNATFNVPGVNEYAHFLKNIKDAQAIRNTVLRRFEEATSPIITDEQRKDLLRFLVVGGGPTSVEFAAEMYDFLGSDIKRTYPDIVHHSSIILVEATDHLLSAFDQKLGGYVTDLYKKRPAMTVYTGTTVKQLSENVATFGDGRKVKFGACVWSTGLAPNPLTEKLPLFHQARSQRLIVNEYLQVHRASKEEVEEKDPKTGQMKKVWKEKQLEIIPNVYSFGDCSVIERKNHPATAQVASAEAIYLANRFNKFENIDKAEGIPFKYRNFGQLAYVGARQALADLPVAGGKIHGFFAYLFWRSVYITKLMSWKNRFLVAAHWFNSTFFGRDIGRF